MGFDDYGDGTKQLALLSTTEQDYQEYCNAFVEAGYVKGAENPSVLYSDAVLTSSYLKEEGYVTVTHITKRGRTYISVKESGELSEHLSYKDSYVQDNEQGAKTTLHMPELYSFGASFIIQLKNGHFIVEDGGMPADNIYLLELLESLVPKGEIPVVEAWFITHGHSDHFGCLQDFKYTPANAERLYVEGVYFNVPSEKVQDSYEVTGEVQAALDGIKNLKTSEGKVTPFYRPQTGQRYYFNDITVDILHTQEQHLIENYDNGFNDSSTWYLYTLEDQTFLSAGDASDGSVRVVKETYDKKYLDFDVLATFHHGQNVTKEWVEYFSYDTVLYTTYILGSQTQGYNDEANEILQERATECYCWGDGRKILTFHNNQTRSVEKVALRTWEHHPDRVSPTQ